MIIIRMKGGLGNQMFQYALYRQLQAMHREVKMDDMTGFREDSQRNPALSVFGINYERATQEEVTEATDSYMDFFSRVRRKIFGRKTLEYEERDGNFDPIVLQMKDSYLVGFWQSEQYFPDQKVRDLLLKEFLSRKDEILKNDEEKGILHQIMDTESVSLHVRRGDYLQPGTVETFGGICTPEYYRKAQERIREQYPDAIFYIFSNDMEWAGENFSAPDYRPVICKCDQADAAELFLMSSCRHHILANSSFSWWGAWLSEHGEDHLTIAPSRWLNHKKMTDIYTDDMTKVD